MLPLRRPRTVSRTLRDYGKPGVPGAVGAVELPEHLQEARREAALLDRHLPLERLMPEHLQADRPEAEPFPPLLRVPPSQHLGMPAPDFPKACPTSRGPRIW